MEWERLLVGGSRAISKLRGIYFLDGGLLDVRVGVVSAQRSIVVRTYFPYLRYLEANMTSSSRGCSRTAQRLLCMCLLSFGVLQLEMGSVVDDLYIMRLLGEECELAGCGKSRWEGIIYCSMA